LPIDVTRQHIDFLAMPGHKGLLGPLGTGALYIRPGLENLVQPLIEGGTGSVSELATQPDFMPDRFESGSHNAIGLLGLGAALAWIENKGVEELRAHDLRLSARFLERATEIEPLHVYGPLDAARRVAVFSLRLNGLDPAELSALLDAEFGILSRSGLHCAPLAHQTIGTHETGGTTRLSFGAYNTLEDVDRCLDALAQLATAGARA
ncbi:MAG: aminotransferase class V-fold PLP-dependent enzyme, partial [Planctomycetota bacterium]